MSDDLVSPVHLALAIIIEGINNSKIGSELIEKEAIKV